MSDENNTNAVLNPAATEESLTDPNLQSDWAKLAVDARNYYMPKGGPSRVSLEWRRATEEAKYLTPKDYPVAFPKLSPHRLQNSAPPTKAEKSTGGKPSSLLTRLEYEAFIKNKRRAKALGSKIPEIHISRPVVPSAADELEFSRLTLDRDPTATTLENSKFTSFADSADLQQASSQISTVNINPSTISSELWLADANFGDTKMINDSLALKFALRSKAAVAIQRIVRGWLTRMHMYLWFDTMDTLRLEQQAASRISATRDTISAAIYATDRRLLLREADELQKQTSKYEMERKKKAIADHQAALLVAHKAKTAAAANSEAKYEEYAKRLVRAASQSTVQHNLVTGLEIVSKAPQLREKRNAKWLSDHRRKCEERWKKESDEKYEYSDQTLSHDHLLSNGFEVDSTKGLTLLDLL